MPDNKIKIEVTPFELLVINEAVKIYNYMCPIMIGKSSPEVKALSTKLQEHAKGL